jgi:hypothetical protein
MKSEVRLLKKKSIHKKVKTYIELIQEVRRTWDVCPATRVMPDKTKYNRKREKMVCND